MNWEETMAEMQKASLLNDCRDVVEVQNGSEFQIRKLMEEYPQYLWKYSEGSTIPGYMMKIAEQLEEEFYGTDKVPTDLYPSEYFRIMDHSIPTELAIQPKRFDKAQDQLNDKMQKFYKEKQESLQIPEDQLIPKVACAVCIQDKWYRGKLENVPNIGGWIYVYLVDVGMSRQVAKNDIRYLDSKFGHYPPMVVRARIRGALIQHMDYDKVDHFRDVIKDLNYLARCQITSSSEPFQINLFHPHYDLLNVCLFLLAPRRGQPSEAGVWPPKEIAVEFNRRNGIESDENDDSGADSDFIGDEEEEDNGWNFEDNSATYLRSFPPATKVFRVYENGLQIERIENEWLIYLTNDSMRQKRQEAEEYLLAQVNSLSALPEVWLAFGTACAVSHEGTIKRAAICGIEEHSLNLLLIDYGVLIESSTTKVFSLANHESVNIEPQLTLISLACFNFIHCSRVEILQNFLPPGTPIHFERERRSKDIPTKGALSMFDGTPIEQLVNETISLHNLDLECLDVLPFSESSESANPLLTNRVNLAFMYKYGHSIIYKKSKLVTSKF